MLLNEGSKCDSCEKFERSTDKPITMKEKIANPPAKLNAPLSRENLNRVYLAMKKERRKCLLVFFARGSTTDFKYR